MPTKTAAKSKVRFNDTLLSLLIGKRYYQPGPESSVRRTPARSDKGAKRPEIY